MKKVSTYALAAQLAVSLSLSFHVKSQVIFRDDFNRSELGSNWVNPDYSQWSIVNNQAYSFYDGTGAKLMTSKKFPQRRYLIESIAFPLKNSYHRQYSILFGKPDPNQDYGYVLKYAPEYNQGLTLGRSEGNDYYPIVLDHKEIILDPAKSHTFKIEHYPHGLMRVYINSGNGYGQKPILEAIDNTYYTLGHIGWKVDTETYAEAFSVDWIEARALPTLLTDPATTNGVKYTVANLNNNVPLYTDRSYTFTSLPSYLRDAAFIQLENDGKKDTRTSFLNFKLTEKSLVYVLYDPRAKVLPAWLQSWTKSPNRVNTTDPGTSYLDIYIKEFPAGTVTLGGNLAAPAAGSLTNYIVAAASNNSAARIANTKDEGIEKYDDVTQTELSSYPNPAQSNTTIHYNLTESANVKLTMYNQQGIPLNVLVNQQQTGGKYEQLVDVQGLKAGIYIYELQTGHQKRTGKLLINK